MANDNSKPQAIPYIIPLAKIHDLPGIQLNKPPDKSYGGLVTSIQAVGVREPVILRLREDGEYQLVTGYRRRRASELAQKTDIPAFVYQMTLPEAIAYHHGVQRQAELPIPGKPAEPIEKEPPAAPKTVDKAAVPAADGKPKEATTAEEVQAPTVPAKDAKEQADAPKTADKAAAPATGDKSKEAAAEEAPTPAAPAKDTKEQTTDKAPKEAPAAADVKSQEAAPPAAVYDPTAKGPAGTAITQVFKARLAPPDEAALRDLPAPKEGESFFITPHPTYLEKSRYNVFSVDTYSENFRELRKSVELVGIKDPVLARLKPEGGLEILSGQRRHLAALELNYPVPTIIQKIDDADAKIIVADGNLHRDKISIYDLSRALRMKMEGMKQKSGRRKKGTVKTEALNSDEKLAQEMGMSVSKLNRMLRLSEAAKSVCDRVDDGSLPLSIASAISFLTPEHQENVLHLSDLGYKPSTEGIEYMKKVEKWNKLDDEVMRKILDGENVDYLDPNYVPPEEGIIPPSPDVGTGTVQAAETPAPVGNAPAFPDISAQSAPAQTSPVPAVPAAPAAGTPAAKRGEISSGKQGRPEYTKIILAGDRLRKYFPVSMTPFEIEESIYSALEERRQRQIKEKQRNSALKGKSR